MNSISILDSNIYVLLNNVEYSTPYIEKHVIIKSNKYLEGSIIYGVQAESLREIFHLDKFVPNELLLKNNNSIYLGKELAAKLNVKRN